MSTLSPVLHALKRQFIVSRPLKRERSRPRLVFPKHRTADDISSELRHLQGLTALTPAQQQRRLGMVRALRWILGRSGAPCNAFKKTEGAKEQPS